MEGCDKEMQNRGYHQNTKPTKVGKFRLGSKNSEWFSLALE